MKTPTILATSFLTLVALTNQAHGETNSTVLDPNNRHSIGMQIVGGGLEYKGGGYGDHNLVGASYIYYNYQLANNYYLEAGIMGAADVEGWKCHQQTDGALQCKNNDNETLGLDADEFEFGAIVLAVKGNIALSQRNSLYGKLGGSYYDYELSVLSRKTASEDGLGFVAEAGWEYRWDNNIGINFGLQYQKAGDIKMKSSHFGVSYQF
ncbi:outer membrane beta-barrel protein [Agaribacter flavus]|uniref:Outer membrane beta-barrel protein n=1 Tax=Agaribacter flavus TaxID=1902781 RepID=A0ABV7FTT9_9ALTE